MAAEGSVAGRLHQLQERLKQEKLFVNKEKAAISNLNTDIVSTSERLYHLSWITRQQWKIVQRKWASPEECSQVVNRLDSARFVDASTHLGYLESKYWDFLRSIRENSSFVASTLAYADKINFDTSLLIRLLLNSLYGNCLLPEDENYVLLLMKHLMELKSTGDENLEVFFQHHRNSFTSLFEILVDSLFSTKLYLTAALHAPIMQVLSEDALFIKRLPRQCMKFVENLEAKLYCFPQSLRWLICQFHNILSTCQKFTEKKARSMVLRLLFDFLICPAILRPHQFGITSDVQISEIASQNLQQISSCLHSICSSEGDSERTVDLFSRIDQACITSFLDAVLEEQKHLPDSPTKQFLPGLCRNSVLMTENELHALTSFFRMIEHSEYSGELVNLKELKELLDKLPPPPNPPEVPDPTSQDGGTPVGKRDSPSESPKTPKNKRHLKKKGKDRSSKHQAEVQMEKAVEIKVVKQFNPFAVVSRSDEFKDDCIKRLSAMFQDDEDVLIISLGYSAIECPGMLSEEKVLGISKPKKEVGPGGNFRPRSSSSSFYKKIFHDKSSMKEEMEQSFDDEEEEEEEASEEQNTESEKQSSSQLLGEWQSSSHVDGTRSSISETAEATSEVDLLDLVHGTGLRGVSQDVEQGNRSGPSDPDVLGGGSIGATPWPDKPGRSNSIDLIDFGAEFSQPVLTVSRGRSHSPAAAEVQSLVDLNSPPTVAPHTLLSSQDQGNRDSAISTGSSTRYSMSSVSTRSSGLEFNKDSFVGDSAYDDIPEEQSQFDTSGLEYMETRDVGSLKRSSLLVVSAKRHSKMSNRDSTSSSTISGFPSEGSNRDSQASFYSVDMEFPPRTSSSSTADEEQEAENRKRPSRAASLKKQWERMKRKDKGEGKEHRKDSLTDSFEFGVQSEKKDKGLRKFIKGTPKASKKSGAKVYERLADQTIEALNIAKVDEKTPKDIENIIEKYTAMATSRALAQSGSLANNESDDDEDDEGSDDVIDEEEKFDNAKRKLRLGLSQACTQNLPWLLANFRITGKRPVSKSLGQELMTFLHVQLAEAIHLQDRSLSAQLHETIRSVGELPVNSYSKLLVSLEEDYKARTPYLSYLIKAHQGLLATQAHLERLVDRVERDKVICRDYFTMMCVQLFLESKEKGEINKFCSEFQSLPIPDEKNLLLERFLENLADKMESHPIWSGVSQEQLQDTFVATERAIMSNVYKIAFYPNGEIDMEIDRKFHEHVTSLQRVVNLNHKAVRVPKMYRKEAPWESAQKELLKINAYKTPTDKLKCIKRCCATIMNLLCLASETSVPGADEFVPALVYVVIHANPLGLLSTVKYVTTFYDKRLSGEEAYYWMQFCAAIAFIKTLS